MFGHPRGLYVLFFTELWERFSFYGMKTLLVLYLVNHFFWSQERASSLLGWYAAAAYGLPVVGGFIADRFLGAKRAVVLGAILLSIGHIVMAFEPKPFFYSALVLIICGVGLLKPNVSTQVGSLYKPGDPRRDGAFTIFYMGINLGALAGPLICDWLRVNYGYHYGFAAAGVGMILGLIVYVIGQKMLVEFNQDAPEEGQQEGASGAQPQAQPAHPPHVVRDRIIVLLVVFAFIIIFWTAFEQSYNAMLLWADKHTNLRLVSFEVEPITLDTGITDAAGEDTRGLTTRFVDWWKDPKITSGQTQSFNPFFIITLAPVFAFLWIWLDRRGRQPSTPTKMVLGLVGVMLAFGVMWPAAHFENGASSVSLRALPDALAVDDDARVYSVEQEKNGGEERVYFGFTRLRYDADSQTLELEGVLPDIDRLRLLSETSSASFKQLVDELVERSAQQASAARMSESWEFTEELPSVPPSFLIAGIEAPNMLSWNADTGVLTVTDKINERAEVELLAAAAPTEFKEAIDALFVESSMFRVSVWWLIAFYLVLTMGELCLSPVGLSLVTKLAPPKHVGLLMGGWFLATAIAEKLAQVFGAYWGKMTPTDYFLIFVVMCGVGGLLMALLIRPLKRKMHGVL